jgi:hypothetical protein
MKKPNLPDFDEGAVEDSGFGKGIDLNPDAYYENVVARIRAKAVIDEMTIGLPDLDLNAEDYSPALLVQHIERLNTLIKKNLDASSIWEFVFLAGDMRESLVAKRRVREKLAVDPKQAVKVSVKELWKLWQSEPGRYKGKAAFARDMLDKFDLLQSQRVIERWCKEWEAVPS